MVTENDCKACLTRTTPKQYDYCCDDCITMGSFIMAMNNNLWQFHYTYMYNKTTTPKTFQQYNKVPAENKQACVCRLG